MTALRRFWRRYVVGTPVGRHTVRPDLDETAPIPALTRNPYPQEPTP